MKLALPAKVLVLAALAVASSWTTSRLLAKQPLDKPTRYPAQLIATGRMQEVDILAEGTDVKVQATARVHETRPLISYYWKVRVRDKATRDIVLERFYDEKPFKPDAVESEPSFAETLQLPPGEYKVVVFLFHFPDGFDMGILDDPEVARPYIMTSGGGDVIVRGN